MELIKRPIHYTQEGKSIFDQFYLDEDYNVPEQKEDVRRIIQGNAECRTEDIRPVENYVKVTGKIYFRILYMTASVDSKPAVLEGRLPFEEMVYAESDGNETFFIRSMRTEFAGTVVNSRKLSLRVMAEMEIGRERLRDEELTEDVEGQIPVYRRKEKLDLLKLAVSGKDTYRIKEEIVLPGTGRRKVSDRYCLQISEAVSWISAWDRMRSSCGASSWSSVCIFPVMKRRTGSSRASPMRGGFPATA